MVGDQVTGYIEQVSEMRINAFREFPYLYAGNMEYEKEYFSGFCQCPEAILVLGKYNGSLVAASTALPMKSDADILGEAILEFEKAGKNIDRTFYFGEVIVLPQWQRKGLAASLYKLQESKAREWGFKEIALATVVRADNDVRRPKLYKNTDNVWRALGYSPEPIFIDYHWPTFQSDGTIQDTKNKMQFWTKKITDTE